MNDKKEFEKKINNKKELEIFTKKFHLSKKIKLLLIECSKDEELCKYFCEFINASTKYIIDKNANIYLIHFKNTLQNILYYGYNIDPNKILKEFEIKKVISFQENYELLEYFVNFKNDEIIFPY